MGRIGVLDSGLGGMVMLQALRKRYPEQDFIFLADQKNSPYGSRTNEELVDIVNRNIAWLKQQQVDSIFMACNTISCLNPDKIDDSVPIQRIIEPTCRQIETIDVKSVVVCATPFTCATHAYKSVLNQICPALNIVEVPLPFLCRDIEEMNDSSIVLEKLRHALKEVSSYDAMILGCTHYPLARALFEQIFPGRILDSNGIQLQCFSQGTGMIEFYTTDDPSYFDLQCERLFHLKIQSKKAGI